MITPCAPSLEQSEFDVVKTRRVVSLSASRERILWKSSGSRIVTREQFAVPRLLCVGNGLDHLRSRCAVLGSAGYDAKSADAAEAATLLRTEQFDLVIVSAWLEEWDRRRILAAAGKTPVLLLTELTLAEDLLAQVERMLQPPSTPAAGPERG